MALTKLKRFSIYNFGNNERIKNLLKEALATNSNIDNIFQEKKES
jgi:hypothetical protein